MIVLKNPEGKKVVISPKSDECLYSAPVNPPNTGTRYTEGTDLYRHVAKSGAVYYYLHEWSMWQGTMDRYNLISEQEAKDFLVEAAGWFGYAKLSDSEAKRAQELWPGLLDEDA
jgi:hypothetical protein